MNDIGLRADEFGLLSLVPPAGMVIGTFIAIKMIERMLPIRIMIHGLKIAGVGILLMLIPFAMKHVSVLTLFIPMFIIDTGLSLIYGNASALALSYVKDKSNASAVINFINLGISVFLVLFIGEVRENNPLMMPLTFFGLFIVMLILWRRLNKQR